MQGHSATTKATLQIDLCNLVDFIFHFVVFICGRLLCCVRRLPWVLQHNEVQPPHRTQDRCRCSRSIIMDCQSCGFQLTKSRVPLDCILYFQIKKTVTSNFCPMWGHSATTKVFVFPPALDRHLQPCEFQLKSIPSHFVVFTCGSLLCCVRRLPWVLQQKVMSNLPIEFNFT